jgi:prepilin-type N-terminal cleavage/methylation domain-containing protein
MKSEFKAKFLQNLVSKKKGNEGFTLIELLVVIIIVGVLAAIALPSFLNQIGKARGSEGKSNIGTINRAQQAYRLENASFATTGGLTNLDAKISGKFYTYTLGAGSTTAGSVTTTSTGVASDLKNYSGAVAQNTSTDFFSQVICEGNAVGAAVAAGTPPTAAGGASTCPGGSKVVQ